MERIQTVYLKQQSEAIPINSWKVDDVVVNSLVSSKLIFSQSIMKCSIWWDLFRTLANVDTKILKDTE